MFDPNLGRMTFRDRVPNAAGLPDATIDVTVGKQ